MDSAKIQPSTLAMEYSSIRTRFNKDFHTDLAKVNGAAPKQVEEHLDKSLATADIDTCALSSDNLLHAGTTLKNTEYVYAVCVYGGAETKVNND